MKPDWPLMASQLGQLGFTIAFSLIGGLLLGLWVDRSLGTIPIFTLLGSLLGIAAGSLATYRVIAGAIAQAAGSNQTPEKTHQTTGQTEPTKSEDAK